MLIDWFTIVAQLINFLILIFLLKYLLYGRIIRAMDEREQKITSRLEEAEQKKKEAQEEKEAYQRKNREMAEKKGELLSQARQEAEDEKKDLLRKARAEVDQTQKKWEESVEREKHLFLQELKQHAGRGVYAIARRMLGEMVHADLEAQMIGVFLRRFRDLEEGQREKMVESIRRTNEGVVIRSAFEIPPAQKEELSRMVMESFGDGIEVKYQTSPDLLLGIELTGGGHKVAWSLADSLETLEANMSEAILEETREAPRSEGKDERKND